LLNVATTNIVADNEAIVGIMLDLATNKLFKEENNILTFSSLLCCSKDNSLRLIYNYLIIN